MCVLCLLFCPAGDPGTKGDKGDKGEDGVGMKGSPGTPGAPGKATFLSKRLHSPLLTVELIWEKRFSFKPLGGHFPWQQLTESLLKMPCGVFL